MKTKFNIIIISVVALVMLVIGLVFAVNNRKESIKYFYDGGYVINNVYDDQKNEVDKIYFETNTAYTKHSNDEYSFNDSDGRKKVLDDDTFVHYNDNSIMALKDGVAIDLNNIDSRLLTYYNIFSESVLTKTTTGYEINNLNETLNFEKLLFKISDKKYLLAADEIIISFSDSQTVSLKNYVEIEYIKENVIKLYNDEANYQTISSNLYLIVDNVKINLEYKTISKNNIKYLTMADMVINSNDNIEVLPTEPISQNPTDNNDQNNNNQQNNNQNNNNNNNQGGTEIDEDISDQLNNLITPNENIDNDNNFIQPKFTVESMEVTSLGFENLKITVEDESSVLYGNRQVELVENSTGNVIDNFEEWDEGSLIYSINYYTKLKPNKEYTLNIKGQYKIEDTTYDRTFVSKIFRTLDIGLDITEDYVTSNTVSFAIYRKNYSKVKGVSYEIVDSDNNVIVEETNLKFDDNQNTVLATTDNDLRANSNYKILIKKIQYDSDEYSTTDTPNLFMSYKLKTLKQKPNIESLKLVGNLDNQKNLIEFSIENLQDNNRGIKSITYNIYNASGEEPKEPIYSLTQDEYKQFTVSVDDLGQGDSYYFSAVIEFDDNQKTVMYTTANSNAIGTSPIKYPQVVGFVKGASSGAEVLDGTIEILDEGNYIGINGIKKYRITLKENSGSQTDVIPYTSTLFIEGGSSSQGKVTLPVKFEGLKPNTEYVMHVYLDSTATTTYIGYEKAKTDAPDPLYLVPTNLTSDDVSSEIFAFDLKVGEYSKSITSLSYLKMNLNKCNDANVCEVLSSFSRTLPRTQNQASELETLKNRENVRIIASEFAFYASNYDLEAGEYYKISLTAMSNKNYEIPIKIYDFTLEDTEEEYINRFKNVNDFKINIIDNFPSVDVKVIGVPNSDCDNNDKCDRNADLDEDTVVGFNLDIKPIKSTKGSLVKDFTYSIYQSDECVDSTSVEGKTPIKAGQYSGKITSDNMTEFVSMQNLNRGTHYCLKYISKYDDDQGREKQVEGYKELFALKQPAKIKGYISKYDGENVTFYITNKDPDGAAIKFDLISNGSVVENSEKNIVKGDKEYIFNLGTLKNFKLRAYENRGATFDSEYIIYDDTLETPKPNFNFNLIAKASSDGRLYFDLPFSSEYCINYTADGGEGSGDCMWNEIPDDLKIYGMRINNQYVQFTKQDSYYTASITQINFDDFGIKIDKENSKITMPNASVIYDNGTIDVNNSEIFFIKNPFDTNNQEYYSIVDKGFVGINGSSYILYKKGTKEQQLSSVYPGYSAIQLDLTEFNSFSGDTNYIGQRYQNNLIHLNTAKIISDTGSDNKVTLYNTDLKQLQLVANTGYILDYEGAITLSNINTIYKTDGAKLKFDLDLEKYSEVTGLNFELYTRNEDNTYSLIYSSSINNQGQISNVDSKLSSNEGVTSIENEIFTLDLKLDSSKTYYYTIRCSKESKSNLYDIFDETGRKYSKIEISTIRKLNVNSKSASYTKTYWKFDNTKTLNFGKILTYLFDVVTDNYELNTNEEIRYKVYLKNENNNYLLKNTTDDTDYYKLNSSIENSISKNNGNINVITKISDSEKIEGNYLVVVEPYIVDENENVKANLQSVELNTVQSLIEITNNEPEISVGITNSTDVNIMVNDIDGVLVPCTGGSISIPTGVTSLKNYLPGSLYDPNDFVYHFRIDRVDQQKTIGYTPIGFNNKTVKLELKDFFKNYSNGKYDFYIEYCSINGVDSRKFSYDVYNANLLNLSLTNTPKSSKYTMYMTDPDVTEKNRIILIEYTVYYMDGKTFTATYNNGDISKTNDFEFTVLSLPDSDTKIFTLDLPYTDYGSLTKSITVTLKDSNGDIITQVSS